MTAAGQDAEAVLPSGTSPGAAQEKVPAVSSDKDGSATSAFESVPAGDAEGQGAGASKEERGPSEKPRGDEAAEEGTNEDAEALASLFSGEGGTPPKEIMQWVNDEGDYYEKLDAEKAHQRGLTWLKAALPLAHKHPKVKGWIKRFLAVGDFTRNMGYMQIFDPLQTFCRERLLAVGRPLQAFYRDSEEVRGLAELYPDTLEGLASQGHLRQDDPLVGLSPPRRSTWTRLRVRAGTFTIFGWPRSRSTSRTKRWWRRQRARASTNLATSRATRACATKPSRPTTIATRPSRARAQH